ncbi:helix-turn-helix domain-containing protein [Morganella morganii]|uniref:helix-turn-helix domain-containing protein n=1 Tax=Morganella morganii TaxID=582 RepID=UPI001FBBFF90|nr:helix-turn-helix domain-containing protein [Morganella morganii]
MAFIDCHYHFQQKENDEIAENTVGQNYEVIFSVLGDADNPEYRVVCEMLNENSEIKTFLNTLRHSEHYWLVKHLISAADCKNSNIRDISQRYGLSGTHFRRLCQRYIGNQSKYQLRHWRGVASVLDILVKEHSLTRIAADNGYCSASHFSNEIKILFGMSPRKIRNLNHAVKK